MRLLSLIIPVLLFISCNTNSPCDGERKLSASEWLEDFKEGKFYKGSEVWIDIHGNSISADSMMQLDSKVYKGDPVIDCKGNVLRFEVRLRTEEDDRLQLEWEEYNYDNLENYLAYIDFNDYKPEMKEKYIEAAMIFYNPPEIVDVDCQEVRRILARCYHEDQAVRNGDVSNGSLGEVDRANIIQFASIVDKCGFEAIVNQGNETVENAWFIVQHTNKYERRKYFDYFMECTNKGMIEYNTMALMIDRKLIDERKPQIFGSQFGYDQASGKSVMHPVQDMDRMIHLRDSIGLMPIEEYAERLGGVVALEE